MSDVFEFVVIGAGSAGCVVAGRLTEDPAVTVCVLEAGGSGNSALVNIPAAASSPWIASTVTLLAHGRKYPKPDNSSLAGETHRRRLFNDLYSASEHHA
jgi:choline dehydrogenase-like flavoprotein